MTREDGIPSPGSLLAFWLDCAPSGWTVVAADAARGCVRFRDTEGRDHELRWEPEKPGVQALVHGRRLAFSYAPPAEGAPLVETYQAALGSAARRENELAQLARVATARSSTVMVTESGLWRQLARELPRAGSIAAAVDRWLARAVPGNADGVMLYFEAPCRQACEFCEVPQRRRAPFQRAMDRLVQIRQRTPLDLVASGAFEALLEGLATRARTPLLTITGHDWLEHPRLDAILSALEAQSGLRLRCYGPGTQLAEPGLARRVARLPGLESVGLTLQSSNPLVHDAIVGARGAGRLVQRAILELGRVGAPLQITLVLDRHALRTLPETVRWVSGKGHRLVLQGFVPDRALHNAALIHARADAIKAALERIETGLLDAIESLVDIPWCAAPRGLRGRLVPGNRSAASESVVHPAPCVACALRGSCRGVPTSYVEAFGGLGLAPEGSAA